MEKGKRLIIKKFNLRNEKIIGTITTLYTNSLFFIKIDETINNFEEGEEHIVNINQILYITNKEWNIIKKDIEKKILYLLKEIILNQKIKKNLKKNLKNIDKNKLYIH